MRHPGYSGGFRCSGRIDVLSRTQQQIERRASATGSQFAFQGKATAPELSDPAPFEELSLAFRLGVVTPPSCGQLNDGFRSDSGSFLRRSS